MFLLLYLLILVYIYQHLSIDKYLSIPIGACRYGEVYETVYDVSFRRDDGRIRKGEKSPQTGNNPRSDQANHSGLPEKQKLGLISEKMSAGLSGPKRDEASSAGA